MVADGRIEPPARIETQRLARQREAPLAEARLQIFFRKRRKITHAANTDRLQIALRHLAHSRYPAHFKRREEARFHTGQHVQNAVALGLVGGDLRHQPRRRNPDGTV